MFWIQLVTFPLFDCYHMWNFYLALFLDVNDCQGHNILSLNGSSQERKGSMLVQILCVSVQTHSNKSLIKANP